MMTKKQINQLMARLEAIPKWSGRLRLQKSGWGNDYIIKVDNCNGNIELRNRMDRNPYLSCRFKSIYNGHCFYQYAQAERVIKVAQEFTNSLTTMADLLRDVQTIWSEIMGVDNE